MLATSNYSNKERNLTVSAQLIYYVYAYIRKSNGTPYYIGKGCGKRAFAPHGRVKVPKDRTKIVFLKQNLSEEDAYSWEVELIKEHGRQDLQTGMLLNRTAGGDGLDSDTARQRRWYYNSITLESTHTHIPPIGDDWVQGKRPNGHNNSNTLKQKEMGWYNNGVVSVMLSASDTIPEGFVKGRLSDVRFTGKRHHTYIWINDGKTSVQIPEDDEMPVGWSRGMGPMASRTGGKNPSAKSIFVKGRLFETIREAVRTTGLSEYKLRKEVDFRYC